MSDNKGTESTPWLCFGADCDTGISTREGKWTFSVDAILVEFTEWKELCLKRGHLNPLEVLFLDNLFEGALLWEPNGGWEADKGTWGDFAYGECPMTKCRRPATKRAPDGDRVCQTHYDLWLEWRKGEDNGLED